jgi:outer membrane biosynthesis protein TonB
MENAAEKKNRRIALAVSLGFHGLLFLLLLFLAAWRAPNPPMPEYGIELNFGVDDQGGGDIQPDTPPSAEQAVENTEQKVEESKPQEEQASQETKEAKEETPVTTKEDSPVSVKEEKKPTETVKRKETEKPKKEEIPVKEKEKPKETTSTTPTQQKLDKTRPGDNTQSQGDDAGKIGDKGNPQGKLDAKALYGKPGGGANGDGFGLSMTGWEWADPPRVPDLPDNDDGKIEFEIECDSEGEILSITTLQRGLSPKSEQLLKDEIRKNSLIRTSAGKVPERSKGRVVFVLKTK